MIKSECETAGPKQAIHRVSEKVGGLMSSSCPGQLPRNEHQARYSKSVAMCSEYNPADELYSIMFQAKQEDASCTFIRDIKVLPDPAIVLASDYQLRDLVRFGTDSTEHCILTVDPTFSLGEFDVTRITYRHLLLELRRTGKPPICVGPILIHYRKTFPTYLFFVSSLIGLQKELKNIQAFGIDGEESLSDAIRHGFPLAIHLGCQIHKRRNIEAKLNDMGFPVETRNQILDNIFGKQRGDTMYEGLVDSQNSSLFDMKLDTIKEKWRNYDPLKSDRFHDWFVRYESHIMKETMLKPVRQEAGLGNPPEQFSTNASESVNAVLKAKVDYKRSELPAFVRKMEELVKDQKSEFELAVISRGKFQIRSAYQSLEIPESTWFNMDTKARETHLNKLHQMLPRACEQPINQPECSHTASPIGLSVNINDVSANSTIPLTVYEGIWEKALRLISQEGSMAAAPGYPSEARTVQSASKTGFHLVTPGSNNKFNCDCANNRSLGICSHVVAVAEVNGKLKQFIELYRKAKKMPSLTKLATSDMPKGRGRKGGRVPRKKQTKTPIATRVDLVDVNSAASENATPESSGVPNPIPAAREHEIEATPQPTFQQPFDLPSSSAITVPHTQSYPTAFLPFQGSYPQDQVVLSNHQFHGGKHHM